MRLFKRLLTALVFSVLASTGAMAADSIDPATTQLPWTNGPARDSIYKISENYNKVHVWEGFGMNCPWCHRNATQVEALWQTYVEAREENPAYERVQFLDLCLHSNARDCRDWQAQHNPSYPIVQDSTRLVWTALSQSNSIPQTFITNCRGELVNYTIGYWDQADINLIKAAVDDALEVECEAPTAE